MPNEGNCVDFYGERLNVGDEVIPVLDEAAMIGIGGIISEIHYGKNCYITITDKNGKVLLNGVDARCYTTQERFDEREKSDYVYSLTFYSNKCWPLNSLPLTNKTNPNYEFSEGTTFIALNAKHINSKSEGCSSYTSGDIYFFALKDKVTFGYEKKNDEHYLHVLETGEYLEWITSNHKHFATDEELKNYIRILIQYFNNADLTRVNNNDTYPENPEGQKFEKTLLGILN